MYPARLGLTVYARPPVHSGIRSYTELLHPCEPGTWSRSAPSLQRVDQRYAHASRGALSLVRITSPRMDPGGTGVSLIRSSGFVVSFSVCAVTTVTVTAGLFGAYPGATATIAVIPVQRRERVDTVRVGNHSRNSGPWVAVTTAPARPTLVPLSTTVPVTIAPGSLQAEPIP